ncbi:hypothetical protein UlMin_031760 [Ulmus minor]
MELGDISHVLEAATTSMSNRLWNKFKDHSVFALYSPFFVCLSAGNLKPPAFCHCLNQEFHFLKAFVQACEMAEESEESKGRETAMRILKERERIKIEAHDTFIQSMGFVLPNESILDNATKKYIDFLLGRVEVDGVPEELERKGAYTLAAIAASMRLYAHLCKEIKDVLDPGDRFHNYRKWFNDHSYQVCEESAQQCEGLLDYMISSLIPEELEIVEKLYHQALKLIVEFFVAQPISQPTTASLLHLNGDSCLALFCGFDETCIPSKSPTILSAVAMASAVKRGEAFHKSADELLGIWDQVVTAYDNQFDEWMENMNNSNEAGGVFNYEGITKALKEIGEFDKEATAKVEEFGLFKDLTLDNIRRIGQHLAVRNGCHSFLENIVENPRTDVHVLSYSWCDDLVKAAFSSGGFDRVLNIHSNKLAYEESVSTGRIVKKIESAMDRFKAVEDILNNIEHRDESFDHLTVYIGGTVSDFLCLVEADIGIVIDSKQNLRSLGNRFGVTFVPLFRALVRSVDGSSSPPFRKPLSRVLYTVSSWSEIHAFILGYRICEDVSKFG